MNKRLIIQVIGIIFLIAAALMLLPLIIAFLFSESDWRYFVLTIVCSGAVGGILFLIASKLKSPSRNIHALDGFLIVAIAWIILSALAAVPFVISGYIPDFLNALFETVSGFSTTGASAMDDVEILSNSMQFWRCLTNWVGGMGILVFMLAITPVTGGGSAIHILRAESPGPVTEKISPKISTTAKYLYFIYFIFTGAEIICLMISGLSIFNSCLVSFATMATGGFSFLNSSFMAFTSAQQTIVTVFMLLAGVNFGLFFMAVTGKLKDALRNEELRLYIAIYVVACTLITVSVCVNNNFGSIGDAVHNVAFSVASLITTTGFACCDMNLWPGFARGLCMLLMFFGACAGSTAGGIKVSRIEIAAKSIRNSLHRLMHPRSVRVVRFNKKEVSSEVSNTILFFIVLYIAIFAVSTAIVALDPKVDLEGAFCAVDTTLNNNGISFGTAYGSFSGFTWYSKVIFIIDMLIGRLEVFPVLILLNTIITPVKSLFRKAVKRFN